MCKVARLYFITEWGQGALRHLLSAQLNRFTVIRGTVKVAVAS